MLRWNFASSGGRETFVVNYRCRVEKSGASNQLPAVSTRFARVEWQVGRAGMQH